MLNAHDKHTLHLIAFHSLSFSDGRDTLAIVEEELESILIGLEYEPRNVRGIQPLDSIYHMTIEQVNNTLLVRNYINAHGWRKLHTITIEPITP